MKSCNLSFAPTKFHKTVVSFVVALACLLSFSLVAPLVAGNLSINKVCLLTFPAATAIFVSVVVGSTALKFSETISMTLTGVLCGFSFFGLYQLSLAF